MNRLPLACHAWAFNDRSLEDAAGTAARLGFRYIDIGSGPHLNLEQAATHPGREAQRIQEILGRYELEISDVYFMLPYINAPDPKRRAAQLALFERLIPFAIALGTPGITISPGVLHPDGVEHSLARSLPALLRMNRIVADTELRLSFEPHMDSAITTPERALLVVETIPGLSITLDYAHFLVQGYRLTDLPPLLQHAAHVHIRQVVKGRLQTAHDKGRLDLQSVMRDLILSDYHGALTVEYMTTVGWHGMMQVNIPNETTATRDDLRLLRSELLPALES